MSTLKQAIYRSNDAPTAWEPFPIEGVIEGEPDGKVHWLRQDSGGEGMLLTGVFTGQPSRFPYVFGGDETFHVLEGRVTITVEGGESVEVSSGDIVSFAKGTVAEWHIHEPAKKFFVISG